MPSYSLVKATGTRFPRWRHFAHRNLPPRLLSGKKPATPGRKRRWQILRLWDWPQRPQSTSHAAFRTIPPWSFLSVAGISLPPVGDRSWPLGHRPEFRDRCFSGKEVVLTTCRCCRRANYSPTTDATTKFAYPNDRMPPNCRGPFLRRGQKGV